MNIIIPAPEMSIVAYVFGFPLKFYGIIMSFSFLLGIALIYILFLKMVDKKNAEIFFDYSPMLIFFSLLGARLFYVIGAFKYYLSNPIEIIMINHGGLSILGAIFFGIFFLYRISILKKVVFFKHCDIIAIAVPLCQAFGRLGNYFNQEAFGLPANGFIKLFVEKEYRPKMYVNFEYFHPTFLYEAVLDFCIFLFLLFLFLKFPKIKTGVIFSLYLILYAIARLIVESIRIDSILKIHGLSIATILSFVLLILGCIILYLRIKKVQE